MNEASGYIFFYNNETNQSRFLLYVQLKIPQKIPLSGSHIGKKL